MTGPDSKRRSLAHAAGLVRDGDIVAIGGDSSGAHPMALVRELARQGRRGLHVICSRGIALDILVAAGCVATAETGPGTSSPVLDRALAAGSVLLTERSRALTLARLRAAACGVPFLVIGPDIAASVADPAVATVPDPFTGQPCRAVQALRPDVAIIHAQTADALGTVQSATTPRQSEPADAMIARSARIAIVSVEQVVSREAIAAHPLDTVLSPASVTCVVEAPYGAHPCDFAPRYDADAELLEAFWSAGSDPAALEAWLDRLVRGPADHWAYLDQVGSMRLLRGSRNRNRRA